MKRYDETANLNNFESISWNFYFCHQFTNNNPALSLIVSFGKNETIFEGFFLNFQITFVIFQLNLRLFIIIVLLLFIRLYFYFYFVSFVANTTQTQI